MASQSTKDSIAQILENTGEEYISGSEIARQLGITRSAVWKGMEQLRDEGYIIEAVRNLGYRLERENDVLNAECIGRYLGDMKDIFPLDVYPSISSTNDVLKNSAGSLRPWHTAIAEMQTAGKGRRSRSFFSPDGSGLYLSMLVKLPLEAQEALHITTAAAVAACRAIEKCTCAVPAIKWVNDIYIDGKKAAGILTEASISMESGLMDWAVMGIGFNVYEPEGGFPEDIRQIAGSIEKERSKDLRSRLAAQFMKEFYALCLDLASPQIITEYKERSMMKVLKVGVIKGEHTIPAFVEGIDDELRLEVRYEDGSTESLSSGEVSINLRS